MIDDDRCVAEGHLGRCVLRSGHDLFGGHSWRLSSTGKESVTEMLARKDDGGKPRMDLLPFDALMAVSEVLDYGAKKYAARNWEKGLEWGRLVGAAMRHLALWMGGQDKDVESGKHHLAHFACCALMLLATVLRNVGKDDRK